MYLTLLVNGIPFHEATTVHDNDIKTFKSAIKIRDLYAENSDFNVETILQLL